MVTLALLVAFAPDSWGQSKQPPAPAQDKAVQPPAPDQRGTGKAPLALSAQDAKDQADKFERERERQDKAKLDEKLASETQRLADYTDRLASFTFLLVCVAAAQAGLFVWQLLLIRDSLGPAKEAAKAAKLNAEAVMNAEGAHLYPVIEKSNLKNVFQGPLIHPTMPDEGLVPVPSVTYRLNNYGKTPAIIEHVAAGISFYRSDQTLVALATASEVHQFLGIVVADDKTEEIECEMSSAFNHGQAKAVVQRKGDLVFHGHVIFRDFFNRSFRCSWQFKARLDDFHLYSIKESLLAGSESDPPIARA